MPPKKFLPALLGGLFIGVLSALPFVQAANCCCLWIIGGGYLAAYVMQQNHPTAITTVDGALAGFFAGIAGAVIFTIVVIPIDILVGPLQARFVLQVLGSSDIPPGLRDMLENIATMRSSVAVARLFGFVPILLVNMVFAPIGGILGAVFSRPAASRPSGPPIQPPASSPPPPADLWPPAE